MGTTRQTCPVPSALVSHSLCRVALRAAGSRPRKGARAKGAAQAPEGEVIRGVGVQPDRIILGDQLPAVGGEGVQCLSGRGGAPWGWWPPWRKRGKEREEGLGTEGTGGPWTRELTLQYGNHDSEETGSLMGEQTAQPGIRSL